MDIPSQFIVRYVSTGHILQQAGKLIDIFG
jgi:hypothetical protein